MIYNDFPRRTAAFSWGNDLVTRGNPFLARDSDLMNEFYSGLPSWGHFLAGWRTFKIDVTGKCVTNDLRQTFFQLNRTIFFEAAENCNLKTVSAKIKQVHYPVKRLLSLGGNLIFFSCLNFRPRSTHCWHMCDKRHLSVCPGWWRPLLTRWRHF